MSVILVLWYDVMINVRIKASTSHVTDLIYHAFVEALKGAVHDVNKIYDFKHIKNKWPDLIM